jgi:hypothetical protein
VDLHRRRAWWWHRQGLDGSLAGAAPADVLARTGWARSVGGANPYLTLFARAGVARKSADAAMSSMDIYELPSARGCAYVLPRQDFALGLQVGRDVPEADLRTLDKLGVDRAEIDRLCAAVMSTLESAAGPMDPAQLKDALGDAVRSLGEEGRKRGQSTTLPAALGLLQAAGEVRRVPAGGRLDQQRFSYARWSPPTTALSDPQALAELARRYFEWTAPASLAHFRWFSGASAAAVKTATAGLELVDVGDALLMPRSLVDSFHRYAPPRKPQYNLVAGLDGLFLLRRDVASLLSDVDALARIGEKSGPAVADLNDHAIVDRGSVVGLWQYDAGSATIVWWVFDGTADKALLAEVERTEAFVRDQLGDARSLSLDSPKSRAPRIAALRAATTSR